MWIQKFFQVGWGWGGDWFARGFLRTILGNFILYGWVQTPDPPLDPHMMYMHFGIPQETLENCLLSRVTLQWQTLKRTTSTDHRQAKNTKVFWEALNFPKLIVSGTTGNVLVVLVFLVLCQHT